MDILEKMSMTQRYKVALVLIEDFYIGFNTDIQNGNLNVKNAKEKFDLICKIYDRANEDINSSANIEEKKAKEKVINYISMIKLIFNRTLNMKAFW